MHEQWIFFINVSDVSPCTGCGRRVRAAKQVNESNVEVCIGSVWNSIEGEVVETLVETATAVIAAARDAGRSQSGPGAPTICTASKCLQIDGTGIEHHRVDFIL